MGKTVLRGNILSPPYEEVKRDGVVEIEGKYISSVGGGNSLGGDRKFVQIIYIPVSGFTTEKKMESIKNRGGKNE